MSQPTIDTAIAAWKVAETQADRALAEEAIEQHVAHDTPEGADHRAATDELLARLKAEFGPVPVEDVPGIEPRYHIAVAENAADRLIVYGIGHSEELALADAQRFADADGESTRFVAQPCTKRLHDHVRDAGGAGLSWEENGDGLMDLPSED